jgi:hypothetical protein
VAVAAVAAPAVCATPATGAAGESEPPPAWVTVGTAPPGSTVQTLQGTKDDGGGCAFGVRLSVFCPGAATGVYYDRTTVHGTREGRLESEGTSWVDGGCADRLAFHDELVRNL